MDLFKLYFAKKYGFCTDIYALYFIKVLEGSNG